MFGGEPSISFSGIGSCYVYALLNNRVLKYSEFRKISIIIKNELIRY